MANEKDPRLTGKRDGSSIAQTPIQLPLQKEHRGHKADADAYLRGPKKLIRQHAQQRINAGKGTPEDEKRAQRPIPKKR